MNNQVFIGRQPIFTRSLDVYAYELLYRTAHTSQVPDEFDDDHATAQVLINAFVDIGVERIIGPHKAFINLPRNFVTGDIPLLFTEAGTVLEILEDCELDGRLLSSVRDLSARGFEIALDDFVYRPELEPLVALADIIKIDLMAYEDRDQIEADVEKIKQYNVILLAEKVETQDDFDFAAKLGCEYFQGFFLSRPNILSDQSVRPNRIALLQLLAKIEKASTTSSDLENIIGQDVTLSYKLLRYLNSAFFNLPSRVESIHRALVYLGTHNIKNWVRLMLMASIDDKPHELVRTALLRARMCELLASGSRYDKDQYFMVGLLSTLDAILDMALPDILEQLPVASKIKAALGTHEGHLGAALKCTIAYERGEWNTVENGGFTPELVTRSYLQAIAWSDNAVKQMFSPSRAAA